MAKEKKSFFERLTGTVKISSGEQGDAFERPTKETMSARGDKKHLSVGSIGVMPEDDIWSNEIAEVVSDAELTVDVYQTADAITIKSMIAGVRPEDLDINITRDMVTIKGSREEERVVREDDYFVKELYWGSFSRTISLPEEIDVDESEAIEKHGLLILKLPKLDKKRQSKLKVKTI
ncbi:MAG: hypothetical protein RIT04_510 [Candidatus Parcubacteria bacterium]|jgi:HSP20 family protein